MTFLMIVCVPQWIIHNRERFTDVPPLRAHVVSTTTTVGQRKRECISSTQVHPLFTFNRSIKNIYFLHHHTCTILYDYAFSYTCSMLYHAFSHTCNMLYDYAFSHTSSILYHCTFSRTCNILYHYAFNKKVMHGYAIIC